MQHLFTLLEQLQLFCFVCYVPYREKQSLDLFIWKLLKKLYVDKITDGFDEDSGVFFDVFSLCRRFIWADFVELENELQNETLLDLEVNHELVQIF